MERYEDQETPLDFDDALEIEEFDESDGDPEVEQLIQRVHAARLAGV